MRNEFHAHLADFEAWVEGGYAPCKPETLAYLQHLADPDDERRPRPGGLWPHQWQAMLRVIYAREVLGKPFWNAGLLLNIVTGGGKTALIAAAMVWLHLAHDVRRFLLLCPNLIVRDRLEDDFKDGKVFEERNLIPDNALVTKDDFSLITLGGRTGTAQSNILGAKLILANIHQFYGSFPAGQRNLYEVLQADQTPFAVFNDEAHNTPANEYDRTLQKLQEHPAFRFRLDTTATPDRADDKPIDSRNIYEYGIPAALQDRVIAMPVVYQPSITSVELTYTDAVTGETRGVEEINWDEIDSAGISATQWVTDKKPMSQQIAIAKQRLREARRAAAGRYRPILFVVAVCKADANAAKQMLDRQFNLKSLIVTEDSDEDARAEARQIGSSGRYDAVVSVAMLREGWDVPEVGVVLLLRKFGSKVYGPQVVGRGLRRVRRKNIGPDAPQICAIVDHPKLDHDWLWELLRAQRRYDVELDSEFDEREEVLDPAPRPEIVAADLLIAIPEPVEPDDDPLSVTVDSSDEPNRDWRNALAELRYESQGVEITDVQIDRVTGRPLVAGEFTDIGSAPHAGSPEPIENPSREDLADALDKTLHDIAEVALGEAGYSPHLVNDLHAPLSVHVSERFLGGDAPAAASEDDLRRALAMLPQLEQHLRRRPGIVAGIVEFPDA